VLLCGGRLGIRPGEIAHFQSDWVDWYNSQLEIPAHKPCEKGRNGGPCHDCQTRAEQRVEHNDGLTYEKALKLRWHPKTETGIRSIPFDWSERVSLTIRKFTEMVDEYPNSRNVVNRRVTDLANEADIEVETLYPHALRAASATYHAGRGVDALNLMSMHGWEMLQTAQVYLSESTANTQRALRAAHSR
jgi:integrase